MTQNPRHLSLTALLGILLGLLCNAITQTFNQPLQAQSGELSMDVNQFFESLVRLINDASFLPMAVGFVLTFTALLKFIIPERFIRPQTLAVVLQVIVWLVYTVAKERLGVDEQTFSNYLSLLTAIGSTLLMVVAGGAVTQVVYKRLEKRNVPLWGKSQPKRLKKVVGDISPDSFRSAA